MNALLNTPQYLRLLKDLCNIDINILNNLTHENFCTVNISSISENNICQQILDAIYNKIQSQQLTYMLLLKNNVSDILKNNKYEEVHPKIKWTDIYDHLDLDNSFILYYFLQDDEILIFCFLLMEYYNNQIIANTPINIYINVFSYDNPLDLLDYKEYLKIHLLTHMYYFDNNQIITDGNILIELVKYNYKELKNASDELKNDQRIACIAVRYNYKAYDYVDKSLLNNRFILKEVIKQNYKYIPFQKLIELNYEDLIMLVVSKNGYYLKYLSINLRDDESMVMAAISNCPHAIKYAGLNCKSNIDISLNVVKLDGTCLEYLSDEMNSNDIIVFAAIKENPLAIKYANKKFKSNETVAAQLVSKNGLYIEYFSNIIKSNEDIIVKALTNNGNAIEFIDVKYHTKKNILIAAKKHINIIEYLKDTNNNLYEDEDIINQALDYNNYIFKDISEKYRNNINIVRKVCQQYPECLLYSEDIRKNETYILNLLSYDTNYYILKYIHPELLENIDFMMKLFEMYPYTEIYKYIPAKLKKNKKFLVYLIQQNSDMLEYIDMLDTTLIMTAIKQNNKILLNSWFTKRMLYFIISTDETALYYIVPFIYSRELILSPYENNLIYKNIILKALERFGCALKYLSDQDRKDIEIVSVAIKNNGMALEFAHSELKSNYDIVSAAVTNNGMALQFACINNKLLNKIAFIAVKQNYLALQFVPNTIKEYEKIVAITIEQNENAKEYIKTPNRVKKSKPIKLNIDIKFNY
uniref:DUF4116 domain-containing protein n=1 Tax=viral metagenome TaxID=1070528 RepID=A0A6C0H9M5_9ZZZZ